MITLKRVDTITAIAGLKKAHQRTLVAPMDGYWETAVIGFAPHYLLLAGGDVAGYCALSTANALLEFYVSDPGRATALFAFVLAETGAPTAVAGTIDPGYLSLCLDHQQKVAINTYLFQTLPSLQPPAPSPHTIFRMGMQADVDMLVDFYGRHDAYEDLASIEAGFGDRVGYVRHMVQQGQVLLLTAGATLLGIGECRFSQSQPAYADVGMIVGCDHRRQGWGTYILQQLVSYCGQHGRQAICSCTAGNIASRKTIEKAGFFCQHRLLDIWFA